MTDCVWHERAVKDDHLERGRPRIIEQLNYAKAHNW